MVHHKISGVREISRLRGHLLDHAQLVDADGQAHVLVLEEPKLTAFAIEQTWQLCQKLLRPSVAKKMRMIVHRPSNSSDHQWQGFPNEPTDEEKELFGAEPVRSESSRNFQPPGHSIHEVLRVLMIRWLTDTDSPSTTITQLGADTGYSYRPVRAAVDSLAKHIHRFKNGSVALKSFPTDAWTRLVLDSASIRETKRFSAIGEQPRTPAKMLERFRKLPREQLMHVGLGGVVGAREHKDIDLIGVPRLDFTVHCPDDNPNLDFIRKLDPALKIVPKSDDKASVVVHLLRRPESYFFSNLSDPVECLLDLHEMRLESQVQEFINYYQPIAI